MAQMRIQALASSCAGLFAARLAEQDFNAETPPLLEQTATLETQYGRFNLWADNIGTKTGGSFL